MITPKTPCPPAWSSSSFLRCNSLFICRATAIALLLCVLLLPIKLEAGSPSAEGSREKPYALIFGTVWGPDNRSLYGVTIKVRRAEDKKWRWELHSDHNGEFALRVPAGKADYVVWADVKRYKLLNGNHLQATPEVRVHVENDERIDTGLHLK